MEWNKHRIKQEDEFEHFDDIACSKHFNTKFFGNHSREIFFDVNGSIFCFPTLSVCRGPDIFYPVYIFCS